MENITVGWFEAIAVVGFGFGVVATLAKVRADYKRRANELMATKAALEAHYEALNAVVDDPALPVGALEMLVKFAEIVSSREGCEAFSEVLLSPSSAKRGKPPTWFAELEALRTSRPDVIENVNKAMTTGLVALFLRWPSTAPKFEQVVAELASDSKRQAMLADRVSKIKKSTRNGDDHLPGGLVAA